MMSGDSEIRTHDPLLARQVLSQLSYTPRYFRNIQYMIVESKNPHIYMNITYLIFK